MPGETPDPSKQPSPEKEKLRAAAERNISALASEFLIAQEWGLFRSTKGAAAETPQQIILAALEGAQAALKIEDFGKADLCVMRGRAVLSEAQNSSPFWYFANNRFGVLPLVFTAMSAGAAYWLVFVRFLKLDVAQTIHHAAFFGFAGAVLKALYWLQFQINKGLLRPRWLSYFIVAPFIGVLLGGVSGLIVHVGFKLASGTPPSTPDWRTVGLFAAFAGFNWEWALEKFKAGAEAVAARASDKGNTSGK